MKLKIKKIKHLVWLFLIVFSCAILTILFLMQIVFLNSFYENYKTKQLDEVAQKIISNKKLDYTYLEDTAYNNGICISVYTNGDNRIISNIYNKGCVLGDKKNNHNFVGKFVISNKNEETYRINNVRYGNKNIVKAIKLNENLYIFLNTSIEPLEASLMLLKNQYFYILILMFAFSLIIGYFISKIISKPIEELSLAAKKIGKGNFDASFKIETELDEINELSSTLEKAKDELSRTDELRRDLMANVGHDLKTPLTMIKAYAEMTRDFENQPQEKKKENLNIIIEETDRLTRLVNDIVDLSKLQSNVYELKLEETDLNQLIKDIIKRYNVFVENEGYNLEYNLKDNTDEYKVLIDKNKIEQVIYNLINNAVNYTGNDKNIFVELLNEKKKYVVKIKDTGKGIKPEEIDKIWDKYYHNNKKHKRNSIGTGLGLSIVKNILEIHKFKYGVSTKKDKGTTFFFEISKKK